MSVTAADGPDCLVEGASARLNDETIADENRKVTLADLNPDGVIKFSSGKKRHAVVKAV